MADLRITGVSNNQLELQAPDGTRHYLEISDDLLKALKTRQSTLPVSISPREIQQAIRLGGTVEELVQSSGADEELISKFASPIIAELNHVVNLARNVRLSLAGDRFTDPTQVEFGVVMDDRLAQNGAKATSWSARKSVEGDWLINVAFELPDGSGNATWSFDPKQLFLVPENEAALQLSNGLPVTSATSKVRNLESEQTTSFVPPVIEIQEEIEDITQTSGLTVVPEIVEIDEISYEVEEEVITRNVFHVVEDVTEESDDEYFDEPLGGEVLETEEEIQEEVLVTEEITLAEEEPEQQSNAEPAKPQTTSRWAEVLFGSKDEEEI
jgi:hypothetical protein